MTTSLRLAALCLLLAAFGAVPCHAVELKVSRNALEMPLKQQLFGGPAGRYYLKSNAQSGCSVYVDVDGNTSVK